MISEAPRRTGLFNEYSKERLAQSTGEDVPLTELGFDPEEEITIYRGVPNEADGINPGDWVTDNPQLAKDYAGTGKVVSMKVKAKDLLTGDEYEGKGTQRFIEEMVYRPSAPSDVLGNKPSLDDEESDPDFDDVDLSNTFKTFKFVKDTEESDPDFDDVDLAEVFPEESKAPKLDLSNVDENDVTPEGIAKRAALLASDAPLFDELKNQGSTAVKAVGYKKSIIGTTLGKIFSFAGDRSGREGRGASKEAKAIKDRVVKLGSDIVKQADQRVLEDLKRKKVVPDDVTNLDAYFIELEDAQDAAIAELARTVNPQITLSRLLQDELAKLSDEERASMIAEATKKYSLINGDLTDASEFHSIKPSSPHMRVSVIGERYLALTASERAELAEEIVKAIKGNIKLNRDMRALLSEDGGFWHPLGVNYQPVVNNNHSVDDVLAMMILQRNTNGAYDKFKQLEQDARKYNELSNKASYLGQSTVAHISNMRHALLAEKLMDFMKEAGMEFDSVPVSEAAGAILEFDTAKNVGRSIASLLERSWAFYPKNAIRKAIEASKKQPLFIKLTSATGRAGYSPGSNMFYGGSLDAFVHEQGHWFQALAPNMGLIEHAFLADRASDNDRRDKLGKIVNALDAVKNDEDIDTEYSLSDANFSDEYTAKLYPRLFDSLVFSDYSQFWETFTTGMEDIFTNPGRYTQGRNRRAVVGSGINKEVIFDPYQDPRTGEWYRDSSMTERIKPRFITGRAKKDGMDIEHQGLVVGLLMMMHDWS